MGKEGMEQQGWERGGRGSKVMGEEGIVRGGSDGKGRKRNRRKGGRIRKSDGKGRVKRIGMERGEYC